MSYGNVKQQVKRKEKDLLKHKNNDHNDGGVSMRKILVMNPMEANKKKYSEFFFCKKLWNVEEKQSSNKYYIDMAKKISIICRKTFQFQLYLRNLI